MTLDERLSLSERVRCHKCGERLHITYALLQRHGSKYALCALCARETTKDPGP